jgi:proteasome lid subunit RPN8/RPN11
MPCTIQIRSEILARLIEHARQDPLKECCGLLAGRGGLITEAFSATNAAVDPARAYEIAPEELFELIRKIRAARLELLGIYHSHPSAENRPSARDIERAFYPAAAYFIVSPGADVELPVRAFSIRDGMITELEIQVM